MMTRELLGERAGISPGSIKAIETGIYQLTPDVALRISFATGVDWESLLRGDNLLLDMAGDPVGPESEKWLDRAWTSKDIKHDEGLFSCFMRAAEKKTVDGKTRTALKVSMSFRQWMKDTSLTFGLDKLTQAEVADWLFSLPAEDYESAFNSVPECFLPFLAEERRKKLAERRERLDKLLKQSPPQKPRRSMRERAA